MAHRVEDLAIWCTQLPDVDWGILPPSTTRPNPCVAGERLFVSVFSPGAICALDRSTGNLVWRREMQSLGSEAVVFEGGLLFAKSSHTLYALDPSTGESRWEFCPYGDKGEWIYSHPVLNEGRLFIGDRAGCFSLS